MNFFFSLKYLLVSANYFFSFSKDCSKLIRNGLPHKLNNVKVQSLFWMQIPFFSLTKFHDFQLGNGVCWKSDSLNCKLFCIILFLNNTRNSLNRKCQSMHFGLRVQRITFSFLSRIKKN